MQNIPTGKDYDLTLYNSLGNVVASSWNTSNTDELINVSLTSGCYYIKIHSYTGFSCEQNYMFSVYKQNALTLSMPYIRANAGNTVSVPIGIQNLPSEGLSSFDFVLRYDSTALSYLNYTVDYTDPNGALVDAEQLIEANKESDGVLKILFLDNSATFTKPLSKAGIIIKLNFQVNTGASDGAYDISCCYGSFAKTIGDSVLGVSHAIFKNGLVMIGSYGLTGLQFDAHIQNLISIASTSIPAADVNGDGSVNSIDFGMYRMYLLGRSVPEFNTTAADVNEDGRINSLDFAVLRLLLLNGAYGNWVMMYKGAGSIVITNSTIGYWITQGWSTSSGGGAVNLAFTKRYDLMNLELPDSLGKNVIVQDNVRIIGIYPYYVMTGSSAPYKSDGGITIGYGHYISASDVNTDASERSLLYQYVPQNAIISGYSSNDYRANKVPNSSYVPMYKIDSLLDSDIKVCVDAINNYCANGNNDQKKIIILKQNEFDALVVYRFCKGSLGDTITNLLLSGNRNINTWSSVWKVDDNRRQYCQDLFFSGY